MEKIVVGVVQRNQPVYISPVDDVFEEHSLPCSLFLFLNHLSLPAVAKHGGFKKKVPFLLLQISSSPTSKYTTYHFDPDNPKASFRLWRFRV